MQTRGGVELERQIRKCKMRHAELEKELGYSPGCGIVSRWITGARPLPLRIAIRLHELFDIPIEWWAIPAEVPAATGTDG